MDTVAGRLSLAYKGLEEIPANVIKKHGRALRELDLTHNCVKDLRVLTEFTCLESIILDHNNLHSHTKFPRLTTLTTLWVNHNNISNLGYFIGSVGSSFPNLRYLSMMNNPAAPSYFNGGTYAQYQDYRYFVISQLPELHCLDDKVVSSEERQEAERIYRQHMPVPEAVKSKNPKGRRRSTKNSLPDLPVFT